MNLKDHQILLFIYRLILPIFDPIKLFTGIKGYFRFVKTAYKYNQLSSIKLKITKLFPIIDENTKYTPFDAHYFYQQLWLFEKVLKSKTKSHYDVGSTYQLSGYLSKICEAYFIDIRPIKTNLDNLHIINGNILNLPFKQSSIKSLSSLHVIEHIGLGRYDDNLDPLGAEKSAKELTRVLAKKGHLYISTPIGKPAIYFNAHRVFGPTEIISLFSSLKLVDFSVINDEGSYLQHVDPELFNNSTYSCGLYEFQKP